MVKYPEVSKAIQLALGTLNKTTNSTLAFIGPAGNILPLVHSLTTGYIGKIILIHHSPIEASFKFQEIVKQFLNTICASNGNNELSKIIKTHWVTNKNIVDFLSINEVEKVLVASNDITGITQADLILSGKSAMTEFLTLDLFKSGAAIVDISVPASMTQDMKLSISKTRPDLTYYQIGTKL